MIDTVRRQYQEVIDSGSPSPASRRWRTSRFENGLKLADAIEARIGSLTDQRVLDIGAAYGGEPAALWARGAHCVGADRFDHDYGRLRENLRVRPGQLDFVRFDCMEHWPLANGSFDIVICLGVLELIHDLDRFYAELARVLKPTGLAVVSTPTAIRGLLHDAHYQLPLISLLPPTARRWTAKHLFNRTYRFPVSDHAYYSARRIRLPAAKHGFKTQPMKYAESRIMRRVARWPASRLWQSLIRSVAFDFVFLSRSDR